MFSLTRNWVVNWGLNLTDIPPRPCRTPGQMCAGSHFGPPPVRDCLPRKLSAIRCVRGGKRETAIVKQGSVSFHLKSCDHSVQDATDPRRCPSTCVRRALGKKGGGLGKKCVLVGKKLNSLGNFFFINFHKHYANITHIFLIITQKTLCNLYADITQI